MKRHATGTADQSAKITRCEKRRDKRCELARLISIIPMISSVRVPSAKHLILLIAWIFAAGQLFSQKAQTAIRTGTSELAVNPQGKRPASSPTPHAPANSLQLERLAKAADKVLDKIQVEENDLYLRLNYFEKPERLDPSSYASKDEIAEWRNILQQLKAQHDKVADLYANVGKDLDAALKSAGENEEIAGRFKKLILEGFPWDQIERKKKLIADFIEQHGNLLTFYDKNWGSWIKGSDPKKPEFSSAAAGNIYKRLRDQIVSTSDQIQKEYKSMSE
jgi:hypothetical protein